TLPKPLLVSPEGLTGSFLTPPDAATAAPEASMKTDNARATRSRPPAIDSGVLSEAFNLTLFDKNNPWISEPISNFTRACANPFRLIRPLFPVTTSSPRRDFNSVRKELRNDRSVELRIYGLLSRCASSIESVRNTFLRLTVT